MQSTIITRKEQKSEDAVWNVMSPKLLAITVFAFLNFIFGYLFQISREVICYLELSVLIVSSIAFWIIALKPIEKITTNILKSGWNNPTQVGVFGGFGISALLLNLMFAQFFVLLIIGLLLEVQTPASNTIIATLTNNVAGNLFCFTSLVGLTIYQYRTKFSKSESDKDFPNLKNKEEYLMINNGTSIVKIDYCDILNIESSQNCITIYTDDKKYVKYQSLKSFLEQCSYPLFKRIHRSYAVNTDYISHVKTNDNGDGKVFLKDGTTLKLSRTFKKGLMSA